MCNKDESDEVFSCTSMINIYVVHFYQHHIICYLSGHIKCWETFGKAAIIIEMPTMWDCMGVSPGKKLFICKKKSE